MDEKINEIKNQASETAEQAKDAVHTFFKDNGKKILVGVGVAGAAIGGFLLANLLGAGRDRSDAVVDVIAMATDPGIGGSTEDDDDEDDD